MAMPGKRKHSSQVKSSFISIRLEPTLMARLRLEAEKRGRSVSEFVRYIIREFCNTLAEEKKDD